MDTPSQKVTRLIAQACNQYPGGLRGVVQEIRRRTDTNRAASTFYADFNPNHTSTGKLKVADLIEAMEITANHEALRYLAALFGYSLVGLDAVEPDAPTTEAEMLQDYSAVVKFHESIKDFKEGKIEYVTVLSCLEGALLDLRQSAAKAMQEKEGK